MTTDPRRIEIDEFLPHPPEKVWRAITDPDLLARWLMPNDFRLEIGHRFTVRSNPIPAAGFGGVGHCEVLDFEKGHMLKIAWRTAQGDASRLDSTVTFTLQPEGTGTRLFLVHDGFDPDDPYQAVARRLLGSGWRGAGRRISSALERHGRR